MFPPLCFSQDNTDRELKEAARQRRLKELEEKRFAWSGEDHSGMFGRSSSENDMEMLTKEGLLDFFQKRSQSPHSPLGRSASARRYRHTMTSIADRELQGYLELFGSTNNPTDYSKFYSLPRSGRPYQRRTTPWILGQDDNRELGGDRQVTSPHAETEPLNSTGRFSSFGPNDTEDPLDNNNYSTVSESCALPRSFCVFQKPSHLPNPTVPGHINVSVEKHTLVQAPQAFNLPSPNNNSDPVHFGKHCNVVVTELENEMHPPQKDQEHLQHEHVLEKRADPEEVQEDKVDFPSHTRSSAEREKEEDYSTVSSTSCDTPLPLDTSLSSKKPVYYIPDCTETDCSIALDYSEAESSPLTKEGLQLRTDCCNDKKSQQDPNYLSTNLESTSPNDQSVSTNELPVPKCVDTTSLTPSLNTEEWDTESCDTAEGKQGKDAQRNGRKAAHTKSNKVTKSAGGRGVRTLISSESQSLRKVVPINKLTRTGSSRRAERPSEQDGGETRRHFRDQSTPARGRAEKTTRPHRHSSVPPDESKLQRGGGLSGSISRWARDSTPRKASLHKPSAKPLRNIPKPAAEEKMCRSTMRALAQAQAQNQGGASSENTVSQASNSKISSDVPSFARNTVASSSRSKKELGPTSAPSTPSRSPSVHGGKTSTKQSQTVPTSEEPQATNLRRVQSVKATSRSTYRSMTPPPTQEDIRKTSSFSEKSVQSRDLLASSRVTKPSWK